MNLCIVCDVEIPDADVVCDECAHGEFFKTWACCDCGKPVTRISCSPREFVAFRAASYAAVDRYDLDVKFCKNDVIRYDGCCDECAGGEEDEDYPNEGWP